MDLKQLEAFVTVAKYSSFSKAADAMYLTQPTISSHIKSLEEELGVQLLVRSSKTVFPTSIGKDFFSYAQNMLTLRDEAFKCMLGSSYQSRGEIDILSSTVPAQHLLPEVIASFNKEYPHVVFRVQQTDSRQVVEELPGFQYDFGLVGISVSDPRLDSLFICEDTMVVVAPVGVTQDLALDSDDDISKFLSNKVYVMREEGSGTRAEMSSLLAQYGISLDRLRAVAYFNDNQSILNAVSHGLGIAIVSKLTAATYAEQGLIDMFDVKSSASRRSFYLLTKKELQLSPIQQTFADFIVSFYKTFPEGPEHTAE